MSYYKCHRCDYISKQKIDMKRHLDKKIKCIIKNDNNLNETDLYNMSLIKKHYLYDFSKKNDNLYCDICKYKYSSLSNYNKHLKKNICIKGFNNECIKGFNNECNNEPNNKCINEPFINNNETMPETNNNTNNISSTTINNTVNNTIYNTTNNITNNITNNQFIININYDTIKGFDEKWDVSKINNFEKLGIIMSNHKFSNTLKSILKNDVNLNVCIDNNDDIGIVYKAKNDNYEAMSKNELMKITMEKIHNHLIDFYDDIIKEDVLDDKNKNVDTLKDAKNNINKSYNRYYYKTDVYKNKANEALMYFYNEVKKQADEIYLLKNFNKSIKL